MPDSTKVPNKARTFTCAPKSLSVGSTLTIQMSVPHAWELGVRAPTGEFYFLASCESDMRASSVQGLDCDAFSKTPRLELRVSDLAAPFAGSGYKQTRSVFREKGRYIFLLAKNLETENQPNTFNRCEVNFVGEKN
jgi:hypothetical protein